MRWLRLRELRKLKNGAGIQWYRESDKDRSRGRAAVWLACLLRVRCLLGLASIQLGRSTLRQLIVSKPVHGTVL
jgi:hypothetical protein